MNTLTSYYEEEGDVDEYDYIIREDTSDETLTPVPCGEWCTFCNSIALSEQEVDSVQRTLKTAQCVLNTRAVSPLATTASAASVSESRLNCPGTFRHINVI